MNKEEIYQDCSLMSYKSLVSLKKYMSEYIKIIDETIEVRQQINN